MPSLYALVRECNMAEVMRVLLVLLAVQAATATPPQTIDLLARPAPSCAAARTDDVVVCGRRDPDRYRIPPEYRTTEQKEGLGRAEARIGNAAVGAATEQADVGGFTSNRIMIRLKIPF
ncbi:hypothetical protein OMW55_13340 [Sphingomonas sp. BN140010]|uniref:Uncharacterized protein n=1 Tax=Sphingomonas arvum TaxID=2992113 RepID=A0ABT3JI88_9SPHN|nr:hypothetical protein [Sphingomonas sp. BN140010]MCW3798793.1 hypothetical protein [Sphingomonas sp. BN140010]